MDSVQQPWMVGAPATKPKRRARLTAALGLERSALETILTRAHHDLQTLRRLTLADLLSLGVGHADAERVFYLVQWERLQAHLGRCGELPETGELEPLLEALNPIFERHFSRNVRLNDALIKLYRAEFSVPEEEVCPSLKPSPVRRFLQWLA